MSLSRLTIVVPVLDEARALPNLLKHLELMMHSDATLSVDTILVDGGSTDGSLDMLRASALPCVRSERGRSIQMNVGAQHARGDILLFLHADTRLPAGATAAAAAAIAGGAIGGFFRVQLDSTRPLLRWVGRAISLRSRTTGVATGDQAIFVSRQAFESLGGFAPLPLFEDIDLSRRLRRLGRVAALEQTVVTSARRWERRGPWRTILRMLLLRTLYYCGITPERLVRYYGVAR